MTRRLFRYDPEQGKVVQVGEDWVNRERRAPVATEGIVHGNNVATDGTDISSRSKRKEYMKREGVADHSDYTQHFAKAKQEREAYYSGESRSTRERREAIGRVAYNLKTGRK